MDNRQLNEIGEHLRHLGHERREVVERIAEGTDSKDASAKNLYQQLDQISEKAIQLMERQRQMIREELNLH